MNNCPVCKEDMPLLSKICSVCGYTANHEDDGNSADGLINALELSLKHIKSIPESSFLRSMTSLTYITFPLITIALLVGSIISQAGFLSIITFVFAIMSLIYIRKKIKGELGNDKFDKEYRKAKGEFEYIQRTAKRHYGKNTEVLTLVSEISSEIYEIESKRRGANLKNMIIWIVIIALLFGGVTLGLNSLDSHFDAKEQKEIEYNM